MVQRKDRDLSRSEGNTVQDLEGEDDLPLRQNIEE